MARTKEFDPQEVLQKAVCTFWKHGYKGTSISDLEKAIGITRFSIYNTWGDKEGLLLASFNLYARWTTEKLEKELSGGIEDIERFIPTLADPEREPFEGRYGCLIVNTILEAPGMSQKVIDEIKAYRKLMKQAFLDALRRSQEWGELREDLNLDDCADYLLSTINGLVTTNRLEQDKKASAPAVRVLLDVLKSWKANF